MHVRNLGLTTASAGPFVLTLFIRGRQILKPVLYGSLLLFQPVLQDVCVQHCVSYVLLH